MITTHFIEVQKSSIGKTAINYTIEEKIRVDNVIKKILKKMSENIIDKKNINNYDYNIKCFLTSPELLTVLKEIFAVKVFGTEFEEIEKLKYISYKIYINYVDEDENTSINFETIFSALISSISRVLQLSESTTNITKDFSIHNQYEEIKEELKNKYKLWQSISREEIWNILCFEKCYKDSIFYKFSKITPPNSGDSISVPIDEIYVVPSFMSLEDYRTNEEKSVLYSQVLEFGRREVILGYPGNGKTTLLGKICFDFSSKSQNDDKFVQTKIPILVTLRNYSIYRNRTNSNKNITNFITEEACLITQGDVPKNSFEYILHNGRAIVLFDGLDEVMSIDERRTICNDIEVFCIKFKNIKVIVTSRIIGYENAPLNNKIFSKLIIKNFDNIQIKEYVQKWFKVYEEKNINSQSNKAIDFLKDSKYASDLVVNPLMLSLLCSLYKNENYIPENRPEIYKKCSEMLFEKWDKSRGIHVEMPFRNKMRPALMFLAYTIYSNQKLQVGISKKILLQKTTEYLQQVLFPDLEEAEMASEEFVEFCKGRAWVFSDVGQGIFQFTHRTFLEYFTAYYLVRKYESVDKLYEFLEPYVEKNEWEIVSQLAIQIFSENSDDCVDKIFLKIIMKTSEIEQIDKFFKLINFGINILEFVFPNPIVLKKFVNHVLDIIVRRVTNDSRYVILYIGMFEGALGNVNKITKNIIQSFHFLFVENNSSHIKNGLELILALPEIRQWNASNVKSDELSISIFYYLERIKDKVSKIIENSQCLYTYAVKLGNYSIESLIKKYGYICLARSPGIIDDSCLGLSLFEVILSEINSSKISSNVQKMIDGIASVVEVEKVKLYDINYIDIHYFNNKDLNEKFTLEPNCCGDTLFTYYVIFMIDMEIKKYIRKQQIFYKELSHSFYNIIYCREYNKSSMSYIQKVKTKDMSIGQITFLKEWMDNEKTFFK